MPPTSSARQVVASAIRGERRASSVDFVSVRRTNSTLGDEVACAADPSAPHPAAVRWRDEAPVAALTPASPGPRGTPITPSRGASRPASQSSNAPSVASPQCRTGPRRQRRGGVDRGGDPQRAVVGRREVDVAARRPGGARLAQQPARCRRSATTLRQTASAAPAPAAPGSAAVSSIAIGTGDPARTARSASTPWTGSSHSSRPERREHAQVGERLVGRPPGAVGVRADRDLRADRGAHAGQPPGVVADADLDLHAAEARRGRLARPPPRRPRGPRRRSSR